MKKLDEHIDRQVSKIQTRQMQPYRLCYSSKKLQIFLVFLIFPYLTAFTIDLSFLSCLSSLHNLFSTGIR